MQFNSVLALLQEYVVTNVLEGAEVEVDETTPLLEWGVMNSLEIVQLVRFVQESLDVRIPAHKLTGDNFINLASITNLVLSSSQIEADQAI